MDLHDKRLSFGSQGEEVRQLHEALFFLLSQPIAVDELQVSLFGESTLALLRQFQSDNDLERTGALDLRTARLIAEQYAVKRPRHVRGRVTFTDDRPAVNLTVRLLDVRLDSENLINTLSSDGDGEYEFAYALEDIGMSDSSRLALRVAVLDEQEKELAPTSAIYRPEIEEVVDVRLPVELKQTTEYVMVRRALDPLLNGADLANLSFVQLDYLHQLSGLERDQVTYFVEGSRLAAELGLDNDLAFVLRRAGVATTSDELLARPQAEIHAAIDRTRLDNRLAETDAVRLSEFARNSLADRQVERLLRPAEGDEAPTLGNFLDTIPTKFQLRNETPSLIARAVIEKGIDADDLWQRVGEAGWPARDVDTLKVMFALRDLTAGHPVLMKNLHEKRQRPDAEGDSSDSLVFLARLQPTDWLEQAYTAGPPLGSALSAGEYARRLEATLDARFPTAVLAQRLRQNDLKLDGVLKAKLLKFLSEHPDFGFENVQIEPYLQSLGPENDSLKPHLMRVQRARMLGGGWREAGVLLNRGLDSASRIIRYAKNDLRHQVGDEIAEAKLDAIYSNARDTYLMTLLVTANHAPLFTTEITPTKQPPIGSTLDNHPNLRSLFGDSDYCECRHCRSVLSPAAYFVDLLQFLDATSNTKAGGTVLGALLARRPDLVDLDLSCENTTTEIPYVDLVLELLENAVALPMEVTIPRGVDVPTEFGQTDAPQWLADKLKKTAITMGSPLKIEKAERQISLLGAPSEWVVRDGARRWVLRYWPRQIWQSKFQTPLAAIPLVLRNISTALQALRRGTIDSQLANLLAPEPNLPLAGQRTITDQGEGVWHVQYERGVEVRFTIGNSYGVAELFSLDRAKLLSQKQYPTALLIRIGQDLDSGQADRIADALTMLDLPLLNYQITRGTANFYRELRYTGDVLFRLQPEWLDVAALTYQNSSVVKDLLTYPENRNPEAYNRLTQAHFPWSLPLSLWLEECRAYLENLGVSRLKLMELLQPSKRWTDASIATEVLGLSKAEVDLIAPTQPSAEIWKDWGLKQANNQIFDHSLGEERSEGDWLALLTNVSILLQQSGLSLRELYNLLATDYIDAISPKLSPTPSTECRPSKMTLVGLNPNHLDRIHRFVRLWRKLGWSMPDLDRAIKAFSTKNPQDIDTSVLAVVSLLSRLCTRLSLSMRVVLSWFAGPDTKAFIDHTRDGSPEVPSLYAEVFQRPALHNPPDTDFNLNRSGTELSYLTPPPPPLGLPAPSAVTPKKLSEKVKAALVGAAVGIRPADVALLVSPTGGQIVDELKLGNLWAIYRVAGLSHALGLSIEEYVRLVALTGIDPFRPQGQVTNDLRIINVLDFIEAVEIFRETSFSLDELEYLLHHKIVPSSPFASVEAEHARFLEDLRLRLQTGDILSEDSLENLRRQLASLEWPHGLIDQIIGHEGLTFVPVVSVMTPLARLPNPLTIPAGVAHIFSYDPPAQNATDIRIWCRGEATPAQFAILKTIQNISAANIDTLKQRHDAVIQAAPLRLFHRIQYMRVVPFSLLPGKKQPFQLRSFSVAAPAPQDQDLPLPAEFAWRLRYDANQSSLGWIGWMSVEECNELKQRFPSWVNALDSLYTQIKNFTPPTTEIFLGEVEVKALFVKPRLEERIRYFLLSLLPWLEADRTLAQLSAYLNIEGEPTQILADHLKDSTKTRNAVGVLLDSTFAESTITVTRANFSDQFTVLSRLHKAALLIQKLQLHKAELGWITSGKLKILALQTLPVTETNSNNFNFWKDLLQLIRLRDALPKESKTLDQLLAASTANSFHALLETALEIPAGEVDKAAANTVVNLAWPGDYQIPSRLIVFVELLQVLKRMGVTVQQAQDLAQAEPDEKAAMRARHLLQAHFDTETLAQRLKPVVDRLRDVQRNALIAHLVHSKGLRDSEALFDHMLIDVHMGACMTTSRLKQAISSVQLFVQRCLMNLEKDLHLDEASATRWKWMQRYRIWEANRKVFLFPENWIEPELRDDKSEIFRALESDLLQDELSHERALEAFHGYLERLQEIAHLTVVSMFEEKINISGNRFRTIVHIVGRDGEKPYRYYYRQWHISEEDVSSWTPWEEIQLQVSSDHILVFPRLGKIYLAWPNISKMSDENWQVRLSLGRRTSTGWMGLKTSRDSFTLPVLRGKDERTSFAFRLAAADRTVNIACYGASQADRNNPYTWRDADDTKLTQNNGPDQDVWVSIYFIVRGKWNQEYLPVAGCTINHSLVLGGLVFKSVSNQTDKDGQLYLTFSIGKPSNLKQFSTVEIAFTVEFDKTMFKSTPIYDKNSLKIAKGSEDLYGNMQFVRFVELQYNSAPQMPDMTEINKERIIELTKLGFFSISIDNEIHKIIQAGQSPELVPETEHFSSGYRELAYRNRKDLLLGFAGSASVDILAETPGRFFLTVATTVATAQLSDDLKTWANDDLKTWAYKDDEVQFYFLETARGKYRVLADGYDHADDLQKQLYADGLEGTVIAGGSTTSEPSSTLRGAFLDPNYPSSITRGYDYDRSLPYAGYNWELFFHVPFLVATKLSQDMRFADAERWFHLIFDPTSGASRAGPARFWQFKPFKEEGQGQSIGDLLTLLAQAAAGQPLDDEQTRQVEALKQQIKAMQEHAFQPHAIARSRTRAYMVATVLKYLENLIAWGDQLFRQGGIEAVNQATQLYIRAARLLGDRPSSAPSPNQEMQLSYRQLEGRLDKFSNAWLGMEALIEPIIRLWQWLKEHGIVGPNGTAETDRQLEELVEQLRTLGTLYFCVPYNEKLIEYWDTVEDRLFKIRNCMNIDGVAVQWPLFEPPIDPSLLVQAAAAGLDISTVLDGLYAPLPTYRFNVMLPKAAELASEVKGMSAALLSALEKQDAEELALLRSQQEMELFEKIKTVREEQKREAEANLTALRESRVTAGERYRHYQGLLGAAGVVPPEGDTIQLQKSILQLAPSSSLAEDERGLGMLLTEQQQLAWLGAAHAYTWISGIHNSVASALHLIPDFIISYFYAGSKWGGSHLGSATNAMGAVFSALASNASHFANRSSIISGYQRRRDDWVLQSNMALREVAGIDKQILAAKIRIQVATYELASHQKQIDNAKKTDDFMRTKYTSKQLYQWMLGQIKPVYFQAYQLAYEAAQRTERAYRFELNVNNSSFIRPNYFDRLRKGLLAGESLHHDLKRMEMAYLEANRREYELTRHVSLLQLNPLALVTLRQTGTCEFSIPEAVFDLELPGHYLRRIKSVSLSIPCVTGPYAGLHAKLTLQRSAIRRNALLHNSQYARDLATDDPRFSDDFGANQAIVTSTAQMDSGLFETNMRDERYLPFEGAGVISDWKLELPAQFRQFDYDTISDVILHIRYTAREGGTLLRDKAAAQIGTLVKAAQMSGTVRFFSVRYEFPTEWAKFLSQSPTSTRRAELSVTLREEHYPLWSKGLRKSSTIELLAKSSQMPPAKTIVIADWVDNQPPPGAAGPNTSTEELEAKQELNGLLTKATKIIAIPASGVGNLTIYFDDNSLTDLWLAVTWSG